MFQRESLGKISLGIITFDSRIPLRGWLPVLAHMTRSRESPGPGVPSRAAGWGGAVREDLSSGSGTKFLNCPLQDLDAAIEFVDRHKLSGAMRDANVAWPKHDSFGAERNHAGGFGAESDCPARLT